MKTHSLVNYCVRPPNAASTHQNWKYAIARPQAFIAQFPSNLPSVAAQAVVVVVLIYVVVLTCLNFVCRDITVAHRYTGNLIVRKDPGPLFLQTGVQKRTRKP
jgi:hypothetical protein